MPEYTSQCHRFLMLIAFLAASGLIFPACKTLEPASTRPSQLVLSAPTIARLAGEYEILASPTNSSLLDEILLFRNYFDLEKRPGPEDRIRIEVLDSNRIKATLLSAAKEIRSKTTRGRFEEGYFRFRHSRLIPFLAINLYRREEVRLTVLENGDLVADDASTGLVFLLFVPVIGGGDHNKGSVFRKIR